MSSSVPSILDLPIGTGQTGMRLETDSMGEIAVPAEHYWGAQTQRSLQHFAIGGDRMPLPLYHAYGYVKKAAAQANASLGSLPRWKADLIARVADEILTGKLDGEFPLFVWQTGSGTQTNMNVNEVIANRAIQLAGGTLGSKQPIHPNDDVNRSQSSNDTFPTAMHIAAALAIHRHLLPAVKALRQAAEAKARDFADIVKIGRTHLQDAVPLTVGQEWSAYVTQLEDAIRRIEETLPGLYRLSLGGTAVGTGLNAPPGFAEAAAAKIAEYTDLPFVTATNKFAALAATDAIVAMHSALRGLAAALMKFANDIRWLSSGPRCGLHELILPQNEPGSSIMPGKVNPTQAEAMLMVCIQVMGFDAAVGFAGGLGNFQLHTMRPLLIHNTLHSIRLLGDVCTTFSKYCVEGIEVDRPRVQEMVSRSLMLVTALSPVLGYDRAAAIAHKALAENITLREAAVGAGDISFEEFDRLVDPARMLG
ncbi:MAG TPA: class II fumarate hydratase [Gemmataceae bacterium]|nr:class II fumarate hydratase [Gemmataceae bacterium]